jgi:hypothetical protein
MCATAHEGLDLKGAVPAAHDLRRVHLGMIDAVRAGEGSARVAALADVPGDVPNGVRL